MSLEKMFAKPVPTDHPLRVLIYGRYKSGKSHFIFTATDVGPVFWQDTEHGSDFYPPDHGYGFRVMYSKDPQSTLDAIVAANALADKSGPRPIVAIDSFSSIWFQQQEVADRLTQKWAKGRQSSGTNFRAWGPAKKPLKQLYDLLHTTRCHVIISARGKDKYAVAGGGEPTLIGLDPDVERNLPFAVDLVLETEVDAGRGKPAQPKDFLLRVMATRSPSVDGKPPDIPIGHTFQDPKFSDLLGAVLAGSAPVKIEDTTGKQVADAMEPQTWGELADLLREAGQDVDAAKENLKTHFGEFDKSMIGSYWKYLLPQED